MIPLCYFISSFFIAGATVTVFRKLRLWKAILLSVASFLYIVFCFMACGRMSGWLPAVPIEQIISQKGYDISVLPVSVATILNACYCVGILFNILTCIWIGQRGGFWKWCLAVVAAFCLICMGGGYAVDIPPLYSLFGGSCGIMAIVGWVLGLTYIEFCVIGNIWVPGVMVLAAGGYLLYSSVRAYRSHSIVYKMLSCCTALLGTAQLIAMTLILYHYTGTMEYAFYTCMKDLRDMASALGMSYEAVNILVYFFLFVATLSFDIIMGKWFACASVATERAHSPSSYSK